MQYNHQEIEKKWQNFWEESGQCRADDFSKKPKKYILIEFPYPSGEGLHVGHVRSYAVIDAVARKKRMEGYNVLFPIGWDAFGLPTENYAIRTGIHPQQATEKNIANYKRQLKSLGLSFDWSREINTTDPKYYKWTQWIFLKLFEKGLAYQAEIPVNWCPSCKIGLANEEVVGGACERCGAAAEKKTLEQWMIKITAYADRLIEDLDELDYPEKVKAQQKNWIGKSFGTEIDFNVENSKELVRVFTTRADTLFGVTAIVLAPEHPLAEKLITEENKEKVGKYISESKKKSNFERENLGKEKTGVFTGSYCINSGSQEKVPVWIGDYVISTYGGGAVMVVPAHDYRDYDFAKKYGLEIREVVSGGEFTKDAFVDYGKLVNSGQFNGLSSKEAIEKIADWLREKKLGRKKVQYKLRDWVFS
ncbi:MAG: leucine--tRNA ligase, partial [bacterium]|nr:leucine--tRNA ligase [bacterium]